MLQHNLHDFHCQVFNLLGELDASTHGPGTIEQFCYKSVQSPPLDLQQHGDTAWEFYIELFLGQITSYSDVRFLIFPPSAYISIITPRSLPNFIEEGMTALFRAEGYEVGVSEEPCKAAI